MSKAFTKEDDEIPEHEGRPRLSSGLPPGAVNYMTAEGACRLRDELAKAKGKRAAELREVLASATVVPESESTPDEVLFGVTVTVQKDNGEQMRYRIVGADETRLAPDWISWASPLAKALMWGRLGQQVRLPGTSPVGEVEIVKIDR